MTRVCWQAFGLGVATMIALAFAATGCGADGTDEDIAPPAPFVKLTTSRPKSAMAVAADAESVYFTTYDALNSPQGAVMKVPVTGGPAMLLATSYYTAGLVVDAGSVYWSNLGDVVKVGTDGGSPVTLADSAGASAVATDATSVYWIRRLDGKDDDSVMKVGFNGGNPLELVAGTNVSSPSIAVDNTGVYWATPSSIMMVGLDGGTPVELAFDQSSPIDVSVRDGIVYWANNEGGELMKVSASGGPPTVLASGLDHPTAFHVGPSAAWFATPTQIGTVGLDGGTVTVLVSQPELVNDITADDSNVYWATHRGDIFKAPLPLTDP